MTTDQRISIFKWGVVLIALVLLFMFWRGCQNEGTGSVRVDTVSIVRDTTYTVIEYDTVYIPKPYKLVEYKTDTIETFETINVDTARILKDYLATKYYADSITLQYGKVYVSDTISRNRITGRGVKSKFDVPVITNTITIEREKRKTIAYIGFEGLGNHEDIIYGVGASFGFKLKNDKYYGIKALMSKSGNPLYGVQFMIPIKFKK